MSFSFFINGISRCLLGEKSSCVGFLYGKREIMNENTDEIFDETGNGTTRTGSAFTMSDTCPPSNSSRRPRLNDFCKINDLPPTIYLR